MSTGSFVCSKIIPSLQNSFNRHFLAARSLLRLRKVRLHQRALDRVKRLDEPEVIDVCSRTPPLVMLQCYSTKAPASPCPSNHWSVGNEKACLKAGDPTDVEAERISAAALTKKPELLLLFLRTFTTGSMHKDISNRLHFLFNPFGC